MTTSPIPSRSGTTATIDNTTVETDGYTFDAENHISAINVNTVCTKTDSADPNYKGTCGTTSSQATLEWAPDAHLRTLTTSYTYNGVTSPWNISIHYDGSQPLFTTGTSGTTLYIGTTGFIDSNGLSVYDRDQTGQLVAIHGAGGFSSWNVAKPFSMYQGNMAGGGTTNYTDWAPGSLGQTDLPETPFDNMNSVLNLARPDGFGINSIGASGSGPEVRLVGELTFQGVRAYDDTTSQWASPDFYSGNVHDPASQRPFMWNGNNPTAYSDPSGYVTVELFDNQFGFRVGHAAIFITNGKGDEGTLYCWCGSKGKNPASGPILKIIEQTNLRSLTRGIGKGRAARYDTGIVFDTNEYQESIIDSYFRSDHSKYNVFSHNCVEECSAALRAAGIIAGNQQRDVVPNEDEGHSGTSLKEILEAMRDNQVPN